MKHPWNSQLLRRHALANGRSVSTIEAAEAAAQTIKQINIDLPVVLTLNHLAHLTDVSADFLQEIVFRHDDAYRVFRVKKRGTPNGMQAPPRRYRTICVPSPQLMRVQRWIAQNILNAIEPHRACFAFTPKRDLVGAAERHAGAKWLVKMDVRHFFESISEGRVYWVFRDLGYGALLAFQMARLCTRLPQYTKKDHSVLRGRGDTGLTYRKHAAGHLPQGAPTSPMLANLAVQELDIRIQNIANAESWTYTRYADDLAFSRKTSAMRGDAIRLMKTIERELEQFGLTAHRQKTYVSPPGARKILLGVLVDRDTPHLTRSFRDNIETHLYALTSPKIGAAAHRMNRGFASTIGMRRHIGGLIAFAHQVDRKYGARLYDAFNKVDWTR